MFRPRRKLSTPDRVVDRIPEWRLQAEVCAYLNSIGQIFAASLEGVRLNRYQAQMAKATGMQPGEPDLRLYFEHGRTVFIEMKVGNGRLNAAQRERIPILRGLGFIVHVVKAETCEDAVESIRAIVEAERAAACSSLDLDSATVEK